MKLQNCKKNKFATSERKKPEFFFADLNPPRFRFSDFGFRTKRGEIFQVWLQPGKNEKGPQGQKTTFSTFAFSNDVVDGDGDGVGMTGNRTNTSQTRHAPLVTPTSLIFIKTAVGSFNKVAFTCRNLARTDLIEAKILVKLFFS